MEEHDHLPVGQIIDGKYKIESVIDRGGMGVVYRAQHLGLGAPRAIKLIHPRFAESEDFLRRFRNEARLAEGLHHPNLVTLYDLSPFPDGSFYLVLEYVEGTTLASLLNEGLALGFPDVADIVDQTAQGLQFAQAQKIIHRDVSPDNMMLTRDRDGHTRVKILDFGIAKAFGEVSAVDVQRTATGTFLGKIGYCSPEQIGLREDEQLDQRTDVFSLAVVAYKLITGTLPFNTSSIRTYVYEITMAPEREVRARYEKDLPAPFRAAVARALRRDRRERTSTVSELRDELVDAAARARVDDPERGRAILSSIDLSKRSLTGPARADDSAMVTGGASAREVGADDVTVVIPPVEPMSDPSLAVEDAPAESTDLEPRSDVQTATVHRPITTRQPKPSMPSELGRWLWALPLLGMVLASLWFWSRDASTPSPPPAEVGAGASSDSVPTGVRSGPGTPSDPVERVPRDRAASERESARTTTTLVPPTTSIASGPRQAISAPTRSTTRSPTTRSRTAPIEPSSPPPPSSTPTSLPETAAADSAPVSTSAELDFALVSIRSLPTPRLPSMANRSAKRRSRSRSARANISSSSASRARNAGRNGSLPVRGRPSASNHVSTPMGVCR